MLTPRLMAKQVLLTSESDFQILKKYYFQCIKNTITKLLQVMNLQSSKVKLCPSYALALQGISVSFRLFTFFMSRVIVSSCLFSNTIPRLYINIRTDMSGFNFRIHKDSMFKMNGIKHKQPLVQHWVLLFLPRAL